jgi:2-polyprenyl-3-methyl-5-hydroxy-6-metoxy-1,4-benzoquinol methylase
MQNQPSPTKLVDSFFCHACDGERKGTVIGFKGSYELVACNDCGSFGIKPFPTEDDILQAIENDQYQIPLPKFQQRVFKKRLDEIKPLLSGQRFLHLQSFTGELVHIARSLAQLDAYGLETSEEATNIAREKYGDKFFQLGLIGDLIEKDEKYDLIYLQEGLENNLNINNFLQNLKKLLKPKGLIWFRTIDGNHMMLPRRLHLWRELSPPATCYFYSKKGMWRTLKRNNFKLIKHYKHYLNPYLEAIIRVDE